MKAHEKKKRFKRACREAAAAGYGFDGSGAKKKLDSNISAERCVLAGYRVGEFARGRGR